MLKFSQTLLVLGLVASFGGSAFALEGKGLDHNSAESAKLDQEIRNFVDNGVVPPSDRLLLAARYGAERDLGKGVVAAVPNELLNAPALDLNGENKAYKELAGNVARDAHKKNFLVTVSKGLKVDQAHKYLAAAILVLTSFVTADQAVALDTPKETQKIINLSNAYDGKAVQNYVRLVLLSAAEASQHPGQDIHTTFDNATVNYLEHGITDKMTPNEAKDKVRELDNPENQDESCLI